MGRRGMFVLGREWLAVGLSVATAVGISAGLALAAPGDLDTTFARYGMTATGMGGADDVGQAVAVQANGKIVVVGYGGGSNYKFRRYDFGVVRYRRDGSLDRTFGDRGRRKIDFFHRAVAASDVVIQRDGKIVLVGSASPSPGHAHSALIRLTRTGDLDRTFAGDGRRLIRFGTGGGSGTRVALQRDGKIVVVGYEYPGTISVARLRPNGRLDPGFAADGKILIPPISSDSTLFPADVAVQPDGKILVAGTSYPPSCHCRGPNEADTILYRFLPDGSLDPSFGDSGAVVRQGDEMAAVDMALLPDGRILILATWTWDAGIVLDRYLADGSIDDSFADHGRLIHPEKFADGRALAVQQDGRIVIAGNGGFGHQAVVRFLSDGSLDAEFGDGGAVYPHFPDHANSGQIWDVTIAPDGKIVVAGSDDRDSFHKQGDFVVARYLAA